MTETTLPAGLETNRAVVDQPAPEGARKYPQPAIEGFAQGACLDLRMRFAMDLLRMSPVFHGAINNQAPNIIADFACALAADLFEQAEARGWIDPVRSDDGGMNAPLRGQARRIAAFQIAQQVEGQKVAQAEQGRVSVPAGINVPLNNMKRN